MSEKEKKEALFRKFIADQCSPEEIDEVLKLLGSADSDATLHELIDQALYISAFSDEKIPPGLSKNIRSRIRSQLQKSRFSRVEGPARKAWKYAAVFIGTCILSGTAYYFLFQQRLISHSTGFGEMTTIFLPDSSKVFLNGNSRISYKSGWNHYRPREVYLSGEAYFQVKHLPDHRKFTVHTGHDYSVEVLGTEFSVYDREQASRVVLNTGKVQLAIGGEGEEKERRIGMQPGELIEFRANSDSIIHKSVNPERYSSWASRKILLDNTSFKEIARMLEDTYGLTVIVHDTSLYEERFSGTVPSENVNVLLKALSVSFGLDIEIADKKIFFKTKINTL